ncbi:MAG: helix-turn-helix transcriptional regulator [Bacteroidales bacterium]|nr:helix-turn-helix transcriptional regulator [Bacteroidales bacterium]MBD5206583.1 helix-turn-helix transcriptional regulator [Bacteroidales bacterium]MBD5224085.1 helix-turn-helix transcriptional regulator [Bacteroidales bacterium]MBD5301883.1 helix-turn-helix transcriptional regulator [Bacteroides sp.]
MVKNNSDTLHELMGEIPLEVQLRTKLSVSIANRIEALMREAGYSKKQFAEKLGRRPSEVTKWLSGEHNFTIATLARIGAFFGTQIITIAPDPAKNK